MPRPKGSKNKKKLGDKVESITKASWTGNDVFWSNTNHAVSDTHDNANACLTTSVAHERSGTSNYPKARPINSLNPYD